MVQALLTGKNPPIEDLQGSSGKESMPKLIDLGEGEEMPAPSQPKRADRPTPIEITWKNGNHIREAASLLLPPLQDHIKILLAAVPEICPEEVPEGQIIYIDDDPASLQLLKNQVDNATHIRHDPYGTKGSPDTRQRSAFQDAREKKTLPQQL